MSSASTIESILVETRVFPPDARRHEGRTHREHGRLRRAVRRGRQTTSRASGPAWRASNWSGTSRSPRTLDESNAPFFKWFEDGELNASYNCLDRHIEHAGLGDKTAIIFEADDGTVTQVTYRELLARVCQFANALKAQRHQEGRPRHHLHADVDRGRGRDAGLRAHRRHPLAWCSAASRPRPARAHHRRRRGGGDHRRRPDARRQGAAAEGHRRRGASRWAAASRSRT